MAKEAVKQATYRVASLVRIPIGDFSAYLYVQKIKNSYTIIPAPLGIAIPLDTTSEHVPPFTNQVFSQF